MSKNKKRSGALADPTKLKPFKKKDESVRVVIETPKGCRNKYAFDPDEGVFKLKRVLPAGMSFPYDFGFVPSTKADDGDPVDVLVLMDEPAFPGCVLACRLVGTIEGQQTKNGQKVRNDRLIAVEESYHVYVNVTDISELPDDLIRQIGEFFVNYRRLNGKEYRVLGKQGAGEARRVIEERRIARRHRSYFVSRSTVLIGKSQCASRTSNRRCSSRAYVS